MRHDFDSWIFTASSNNLIGCAGTRRSGQNLTTTSLLENRELSLALDTTIAPDLIAAVESTFDADYAAAPAQ